MGLSAAIILAAGEGTRMKSRYPKVLHSLAGKTLLNRVMNSVSGLDPAITAVVVHYQKESVSKAALKYNPGATIIEQDDIPGTGRAVQCALNVIGESLIADGRPVLITASDMPLLDTATLTQFVDEHHASGNLATVLTTTLKNPYGYGRIVRGVNKNVERIVEQKDATDAEQKITEVNTSVYLFDPSVLIKAVQGLQSNNAQSEFYLTDALAMARQYGAVGGFKAPDSLVVQGVNDRVQLSHLAKAHNQRVCREWMREGVGIDDPATTWIDDDVQIESDAHILPGTFLQGKTVIEHDATVGPYTTIIDGYVHAGATVERSRVQESSIGADAMIGPWTYLRPGNELAEGTKAGAYVEMKKAHIDAGSKVPHLSYIGDTHIGEHTNVGGGTITANYDGVHKHHTEIGSGVHVGAGNLFVAPVEVGNQVTTGAGSVIRHHVDDNSMVYSENTQHEVKDWQPHSSEDNN